MFGWAAVHGPQRMDWPTYAAARQYIAEQRIGVRIRDAERAEDAEFNESRSNMERRR